MSGGYSGGAFGSQGSGSSDYNRYGISMGRYGTRGGYGGASYGGDFGSSTRYGGNSDWDRGYGNERDWGSNRSNWDRGEDRNWLEKAGDKISSWFGDDDNERSRGYRGRGPKGYRRSDERIKEDVNDRLTDDAMIDASDIEVEVKDGEVTLSGKVDNRRIKRYAEDIVESIPGVRDVENKLKTRERENWGTEETTSGTRSASRSTSVTGRSDEGNERGGRTGSTKGSMTGATSAS